MFLSRKKTEKRKSGAGASQAKWFSGMDALLGYRPSATTVEYGVESSANEQDDGETFFIYICFAYETNECACTVAEQFDTFKK